MKSRHKGLISATLFIVFLLVFYIFYREGTLSVDKTSKKQEIFVVPKGESLIEITRKLEKEGLIRNRLIFYLVVKQLGIEKNIQAGDFRLSPSMNAYQIARSLTHGTLDVWITIIEGQRKEEVAEVISDNLTIPEIEFIKKAQEGYLFPDTYLIPRKATAEGIITILTNNFNKKFDETLKDKVRKLGLTERQALILASLVEREAKFDEDRPKVSSVLIKRFRSGIPLQVDATIQYALGYQSDERTWWKKHLTFEDLKIDSPYNTYENAGFPPGPITNPGLASLQAVADADLQATFLFYVSDKKGHLHFAKTSEEHQTNIEKYLK